MSTKQITFVYHCLLPGGGTSQLNSKHDYPSALSGQPAGGEDKQTPSQTLKDLVLSHDADVLSISANVCVECGKPAKDVHHTTVDSLLQEPFVVALYSHVMCGGTACEWKLQKLNVGVAYCMASGKDSDDPERGSKLRCSKCKEEKEGLDSCAGCRTAVYCGKDCQKADWQRHKDC